MNETLRMPASIRQAQLCLNKAWKDDEGAPPWLINLFTEGEEGENHLFGHVEIHGTSYSNQMPLTGGRSAKAVTCDKSTLHLTEGKEGAKSVLHIYAPDSERVSIMKNVGPLVLVRLNTDWLKDHSLPPWRVIEQDENGEFRKGYALMYSMTAHSFGLRHDFPEDGRKMHIACHGRVEWLGDKGSVAKIVGRR